MFMNRKISNTIREKCGWNVGTRYVKSVPSVPFVPTERRNAFREKCSVRSFRSDGTPERVPPNVFRLLVFVPSERRNGGSFRRSGHFVRKAFRRSVVPRNGTTGTRSVPKVFRSIYIPDDDD